MSVVIVAPGQGSQTPGFLEPWLAESRFADHLGALADAAGLDLRAFGTVADADTIRDTAVAQPLIVAASLLAFAAVSDGRRDRIAGVAGHSVGEITAAAAAGILTEALAPYLSAERTDRMLSNTPMGRMGQPEDIACAAVFLLSPAASWITGKILGVDGGVESPNF